MHYPVLTRVVQIVLQPVFNFWLHHVLVVGALTVRQVDAERNTDAEDNEQERSYRWQVIVAGDRQQDQPADVDDPAIEDFLAKVRNVVILARCCSVADKQLQDLEQSQDEEDGIESGDVFHDSSF